MSGSVPSTWHSSMPLSDQSSGPLHRLGSRTPWSGGTHRRMAEWRLDIGGCDSTPATEEVAPAWMQAGMAWPCSSAGGGEACLQARPENESLPVHFSYPG